MSGRVVDERGIGIGDAEVTFSGEQKLRDLHGVGYTDVSGSFTLLAWSSNEAAKQGEPMGRLAARAGDGRVAVGDAVSIGEDGTVSMPDLVMRSGATLSGQVLAEDGAAAAGAQVTARSAGPVEVQDLRGRTASKSRRQYVASVYADEMGRYEFKQLPPGRYTLRAEAGYFGSNQRAGDIDLTTNTSAWLELRVDDANLVRGVLTDESGQPVAGAVVQLLNVSPATPGPPPSEASDNEPKLKAFRDLDDRVPRRLDDTTRARLRDRRRAVTDSAGRFGIGPMPDAEYVLASKIGDSEVKLEGVKPNQPDYTLQIAINTSVSGIVRDAESGIAIENYDIRVMRGGNAAVTPFDRVSENGVFDFHPNGGYLATNPPLADGVIRVSAPGYAPSFAEIGELREGDNKRDLDVSLKPLCEVSFDIVHEGKKLDLEPVAVLFDGRLAYESSSNELGRVRIPGVSPATYIVKVVLADGTQLEGEMEVPARRTATLELKLS